MRTIWSAILFFSHSVERRQPQKWKCTCRESIFNRIAALKAHMHVYIHTYIYVCTSGYVCTVAAKRICTKNGAHCGDANVEIFRAICWIYCNNNANKNKQRHTDGFIPFKSLQIIPMSTTMSLCAMFHHDRDKLALQQTDRRTTTLRLGCASFNALQTLVKIYVCMYILQGYNNNIKHKGSWALQCTG